jgi:hypothetical protein
MSNISTPQKIRTLNVIPSPKPKIVDSALSPFMLTLDQAKNIGAKSTAPKSVLLENKYFFIAGNHKNGKKIKKYIIDQQGVICRSPHERQDIYYIGEKNDSEVTACYHSDVIFELYNSEPNQLENVIRVLISLFDRDEKRPFQRRLELLNIVEELRNENDKIKQNYEQSLNKVEKLRDENANIKQNYEQSLNKVEKLRDENANIKQNYEQSLSNIKKNYEQRIQEL